MAAVKKTVRKKKRERKNVERGQAHIQSTFNNTLITLTDMDGKEAPVRALRSQQQRQLQ